MKKVQKITWVVLAVVVAVIVMPWVYMGSSFAFEKKISASLVESFQRSVNAYDLYFTEPVVHGKRYIVKDKKYDAQQPEHRVLVEQRKIISPDTLVKWPYEELVVVVDDRGLRVRNPEKDAKVRASLEQELLRIKKQVEGNSPIKLSWVYAPDKTSRKNRLNIRLSDSVDILLVKRRARPVSRIANHKVLSRFKVRSSGQRLKVFYGDQGALQSVLCKRYVAKKDNPSVFVKRCILTTLGLFDSTENDFPQLLGLLYGAELKEIKSRSAAVEILTEMIQVGEKK